MKLALTSIVLLVSLNVSAQIPYKTAVGLRFGGTEGLTIKAAVDQNTAIEGIIGLHPYGMSITGLYEKYQTSGLNKVQLYYGLGAHIGRNTYNNYYYRKDRNYFAYRQENHFGFDAIIGLEYRFDKTPIAISIDFKPGLNFYQFGGAALLIDPGFGIKAAF
jgi:hypothetical protein